MKRLFIFYMFLFGISVVNAQKARNLSEAVSILIKKCGSDLKRGVVNASEGDLRELFYQYKKENNELEKFLKKGISSDLYEYFHQRGVGSMKDINQIVLTAFKWKLEGRPIDEQFLIGRYSLKEGKTDMAIEKVVPANLEECNAQLESQWEKEDMVRMRALPREDFIRIQRKGLGAWIEHQWLLSEGSQLAGYFKDQGVQYKDQMITDILSSFYDYMHTLNLSAYYSQAKETLPLMPQENLEASKNQINQENNGRNKTKKKR